MKNLLIFTTGIGYKSNIESDSDLFCDNELVYVAQKNDIAYTTDNAWVMFDEDHECTLPVNNLIERGAILPVDMELNNYEGETTSDQVVNLMKALFKAFGLSYSSLIREQRKGAQFVSGRQLKFYGVRAKKSFREGVTHPQLLNVVNAALSDHNIQMRHVNTGFAGRPCTSYVFTYTK